MDRSGQLEERKENVYGSSDSTLAPTETSVKSEAERRLVRKLDMRIMTILCVMNSLSFIDTANLGGARLQVLPQDVLHGDPTGKLFGWVNAAFYFPYIIAQIPAAILFKFFRPHIWLGCIVTAWGLCCVLTAASFDFPGIMVARFILGIFEAGFVPTCPLYLGLFYTQEELASRTAYFVGVPAFSGIFAALISFGVQHGHTAISNWRLLFIVEGVPSVLIGLLALFILPDRPEKTRIFKGEERELALERINRGCLHNVGTPLNRRHLIAGLTDWKVYALGVILFCGCTATGSLVGFLPTIITTFGYSDAMAQILTMPISLGAVIVVCLNLRALERIQSRGPFIIGGSLFAGIGYVLLLVVESNIHARYFVTVAIAMGISTSICILVTWYAHNFGSESKTTSSVALSLAIGQSGNILGSNLFPLTEGPRYIKGFAIVGALQFFGALVGAILYLYYRYENSRRDRKYGKPVPGAPVDTSELADEVHITAVRS